jgi:hypothetical protein
MIRNFSFDRLWIGLVGGLFLPPLCLIIIYLTKAPNSSLAEYFDFLITYKVFTKLISLCAAPNLLLFFIFIWTNRLLSARGVLFATILYTFFIIIFNFF